MSISIPQADFTPQLAGYPGQGAFRFWCQKVLPIVYDDSLSYYELLNKVVNYLNNVIADVRSMGDNIGALSGAFDNLQGFVNEELQATAREINTFENSTNTRVDQFIETVNHALTTFQEFLNEYFDNLDVQEEINNKLDEMARNGDLTALVRPIITEQAPNIISDWLEENITPTSPAVDASLSVSGAAADAKVVGEFRTAEKEENEFLETILTNTSKSYVEKVYDVPVDKFSTLNSVTINNENTEIISGGGNGIVFPVLAGVIVRIKKPVQTSVCQVCFTAEYPAEDVSITHDNVFSGVVNTDISVTSNSGDKYVFLYVGTRSVSEVLEGLEVSLKPIDDSSRPGDIFGVDIINALSTVYNAYTSQVSDIPYSKTPTIGTSLSIDTENLKLVSGSGAGVIVPVIEGTSVRVKKPQTTVCVACFTREPPKAGTSITHYTSFTGYANTDIVAGSNSGDKYLYVYTGSTTINANDVEVMYSQTLAGVAEYLPHLDKHMINMLKYRPVGKVSKPYIALSCDDGLEPLATYTLPRIQYWNNYYNTNIPLHMALFNNSPVLTNPTYKELVVDMCENHNCSIGIHGPSPFENYETLELYNFLQKQEQFITDTTGISPSSIIYPHSSYNDLIMTMCGSWYNICGASGEVPSPFTYSDNNGLAFYVGEKSNCYEVYRLSILDQQIVGDSGIEAVIDYAYDHNLIICPYFHDIAFTNYDDYTNNYNRARLDKFISYGMQKGIEFINFGDIPSLL